MSNVGKSVWSKRLEEHGFIRFGCDDFILAQLAKQGTISGEDDLSSLAQWLGFPFDTQYAAASKQYLELEERSLTTALDYIESNQSKLKYSNVVLDTTGSLVYASQKIHDRLQKLTEVVHLLRSDQSLDEKFDIYMQEPKPVIWGDAFSMKEKESSTQALKRSYKSLLDYRTKKYLDLARSTLCLNRYKNDNWHVADFLRNIYS